MNASHGTDTTNICDSFQQRHQGAHSTHFPFSGVFGRTVYFYMHVENISSIRGEMVSGTERKGDVLGVDPKVRLSRMRAQTRAARASARCMQSRTKGGNPVPRGGGNCGGTVRRVGLPKDGNPVLRESRPNKPVSNLDSQVYRTSLANVTSAREISSPAYSLVLSDSALSTGSSTRSRYHPRGLDNRITTLQLWVARGGRARRIACQPVQRVAQFLTSKLLQSSPSCCSDLAPRRLPDFLSSTPHPSRPRNVIRCCC